MNEGLNVYSYLIGKHHVEKVVVESKAEADYNISRVYFYEKIKYLGMNIGNKTEKVKDEKGNVIYYEDSNGDWYKREYNEKGSVIYYENSNGYWYKNKYDEKGNVIYYEDSNGDYI